MTSDLALEPGMEFEMSMSLKSQFGHPHGTLGKIIGWVMAVENRRRNEWVVRQLPLRNGSRVLEIGFGPGVALQSLENRLGEGEIVGVDPSSVMVGQATRRNAAAIRKGRIRLVYGTVEKLSAEDGLFDVVYSVNALGRHVDLKKSLEHIHKLIRPGGSLAIAHQSPSKQTEEEQRSFRRFIHKAMVLAGFCDVQILQQETKTQPICMVMGRRAAETSVIDAASGQVLEAANR